MSVTALKEDMPFGTAGTFDPNGKGEKDAERQGSVGRRYSRIGPPMSVSRRPSDPDKADIGRQIELEADAAIKYRTCSWQKVFHSQCLSAGSIHTRFDLDLENYAGTSFALPNAPEC
jgi:hypothetical protein